MCSFFHYKLLNYNKALLSIVARNAELWLAPRTVQLCIVWAVTLNLIKKIPNVLVQMYWLVHKSNLPVLCLSYFLFSFVASLAIGRIRKEKKTFNIFFIFLE